MDLMNIRLNDAEKQTLMQVFPNMRQMADRDICLAFQGISAAGQAAQELGALMACDFYARILLGLECERERRGYKSHREMVQVTLLHHQAEAGEAFSKQESNRWN
jgi:hypothetical protein